MTCWSNVGSCKNEVGDSVVWHGDGWCMVVCGVWYLVVGVKLRERVMSRLWPARRAGCCRIELEIGW